MITVVHQGKQYTCSVAIKGADYIHLLDENGCMCTAFDGVTDFSAFQVHNGDWTLPIEDHNCRVAVVREDGSVAIGGHRCCLLLSAGAWSSWHGSEEPVLDGGNALYQVRCRLESGQMVHVAPFEITDDCAMEQIVATLVQQINGAWRNCLIYVYPAGAKWMLVGEYITAEGIVDHLPFEYQYRILRDVVPDEFLSDDEYLSGDGVEY